ncbi:hypothetical protein [Acinetobacter sp. ANC 5045]|uniref:hypothetical protein n=1 Tax=Acinetobacter sp. ANC 5045 TaxID=2529851 RepID=UPI001D191120|nr:hypothetical protein [Acinetobacter sp. ANC 5045]
MPQKSEYLKPNQWDTLSQDDLRFIHSQLLTEKDLHKSLLEKNLILEIEKVLLKT